MSRRVWTPVITAAVLWPAVAGSWVGVARLDDHRPGDDTSLVRLPMRGDRGIEHGDTIEVTLYGDDNMEFGEGRGGWCAFDSLVVEDGTIVIVGGAFHFDTPGGTDGSGNFGEGVIKQQFIVDLEGPTADFSGMPSRFEAAAGITIHVCVADEGAGVGSISCRVAGPGGMDVEVENLTLEDGCIAGDATGPLPTGTYRLVCDATDRVGNHSSVEHAISVDSAILSMTDSFSYPNPFNPDVEKANIHFTLAEPADVTIKLFDFAGDIVKTLTPRQPFSAATYDIPWSGEAEDGTDLANGVYICRITATDGGRTQEANLKVAIWRE